MADFPKKKMHKDLDARKDFAEKSKSNLRFYVEEFPSLIWHQQQNHLVCYIFDSKQSYKYRLIFDKLNFLPPNTESVLNKALNRKLKNSRQVLSRLCQWCW